MKLLDYEKEHMNRVREGLPECMVLLKKNGSFPLDEPGRLAAYGSGVRHSIKGGTGSGDVNAHFTVNIEQGLKEAGFELISADWLDHYDLCRATAKKAFRKEIKKEARAAGSNVIMYAMGAVMPEPEYDLPLDYSADAAIYVLSRISGEGSDRRAVPGDFLLTETEIRDICTLDAHYDHFMLVLNTGGPVDLTPVEHVGNILVLSQLGTEMGRALADVLLGRTVPSGKLATTWASWEDYCPEVQLGGIDDTYYREGVYVGYRYFDTVGKRALYPFGFGLSYTDFSLGESRITLGGSTVSAAVTVTNTGSFFGKEVVQVYVTAPEVKLQKPWQDLAGFAKTGNLMPGSSETVTITFDIADLASFDEARQVYCLEPGKYIIRIGTSSTDNKPAAVISLSEEIITKKVHAIVPKADFTEVQYERTLCDQDLSALPHMELDPAAFTPVSVNYVLPTKAISPEIKALSDEELAYMAVGHFSDKGGLLAVIGNASPHVAGAAGETTSKLTGQGFNPMVMADGPAGLRLAKEFYEDEKGMHALGAGSIPAGILDLLSAPLRKIAKKLISSKPPKNAEIRTQYCTSLPIGTALAQSWNLDYAHALGDIVGSEMDRFGVHLWLAPALNIHRSVLCGRNFEYYSEDPFVSGKMAAAITQGVQAHAGRGTTIKHFAANNQELNRYFNNSHISERALREIYLKGFALCIREARPLALMTSYNLLNGRHTSESRGLIEDYLRAEQNYTGIVMTDWVMNITNLGKAYAKARASRVAAAGGDLFMPGSQADYDHVLTALKSGMITRRQLEENAQRVLALSEKATQ